MMKVSPLGRGRMDMTRQGLVEVERSFLYLDVNTSSEVWLGLAGGFAYIGFRQGCSSWWG